MVSFNNLPIMDKPFYTSSCSLLFACRKLLLFPIILSLELRVTVVNFFCVCVASSQPKDTEINLELNSCPYLESGSSVTATCAESNASKEVITNCSFLFGFSVLSASKFRYDVLLSLCLFSSHCRCRKDSV